MSLGVSGFYAMMLTVLSGYSYGAGFLLVGGVLALAQRVGGAHPLSHQDRTLCMLLLAFFAATLLAVLWHQDPPRYLDQALRYLLAIPILIALLRVPIRIEWLWLGLAVGLLGAAGIAWWQVHLLGINRATGFVTSAIPFADISLTMAAWCLLGAWWAGVRHRWAWTALLLAGALGGVYAFVAAATRGALVALPVMAVLVAIALVRREHLRAFGVACAGLAVAAMLMFTVLPISQIAEERYTDTLTEWHNYVENGDATNNVGSRLEVWKAALISIPEKPLLGWGHEDYTAHLDDLVASGRIAPFAATLANTHNNFIEIWLHQGSLGLLAYLALMITCFWYFCQRLRSPDLTVRILACCGAILPASFAMYGLTHVILGRNNGVMFFVVSLAVLWAAMRQAEERG